MYQIPVGAIKPLWVLNVIDDKANTMDAISNLSPRRIYL